VLLDNQYAPNLRDKIAPDVPDRIPRKIGRLEDKMQRRQYRYSGAAGIVIGSIIALLGLGLLLDNMAIVQFHDMLKYWPALLIAYGISQILSSQGTSNLIFGGEVALIGALVLLNNLDVVRFSFDYIWPLAMIAFGLGMLVRTIDRKLHIGRGTAPPATGGSVPHSL